MNDGLVLEKLPPEPIGKKVLDHPKLNRWKNQGYVKQMADGLWLHYVVVCELLGEKK